MPLAPERIGPYPIERELGRGGMGVVYLGRDPALGRPVAVKVLPLEVAADPQRLARFDREARMLAAVHHPNVASIFGVGEDDDGHRYLALEFVPGESLAERLDRSPLPLGESIAVCTQLAAGLEAAHEAGVVHRDLKPGNVRLTPDGGAKLLDFGLAKGAAPAGSGSGSGEEPSRTLAELSTEGAVLGTVTYMSPEQATGTGVDRRTDVWALGCILFECLAGRAPFEGNTPTDTMVKILEREPPWEQLPPETPPRVRDLLRRCLEKDRRRRLRDAGDARLELEAAHAERGSSSEVTVMLTAPRRRRRRLAAVVALGSALVAGLLGWWLGRREAAWPAKPLHLAVAVPSSLRASLWTLTRDGSNVFFWARPRAATTSALRLYRRRLDNPEVTEVPGSEGIVTMVLSPDGRWLYVARDVSAGATAHLMRMPVDGSAPPVDIAELDPEWTGMTALDDGVLVMLGNGDRMVRLDGSSGKADPPIRVDLSGSWLRTSSSRPLPDGRVLFDAAGWGENGFQIGTLLVDPATGKTQRLLEDGHQARFVAPGRLLFARGTVLLGAPFDARAGRFTGEPVALTGDVFSVYGADWELGENGTLAYRTGADAARHRRLVAVAPRGNDVVPWSTEQHEYVYGSASRDGRWVYAGIRNARQVMEIWKVPRQGAAERLWAVRHADVRWPVPSPDGRWLAFTQRGSGRGNGVYLLDLERRAEPRLLRAFTSVSEMLRPLSWLPDSSRLLMAQGQNTGDAVLEVAVDDAPTAPPRLLLPPPSEHAVVSPDGRWIAFDQDRAGSPGVHVAPYPRSGALKPGRAISDPDGREPRWSPDGRTLYYSQSGGLIFAMPIRDGAPDGEPQLAVTLDDPQGFIDYWFRFDVLPDGRLLFVQRSEDEGEVRDIELVLGFGRDLARRLDR